MSQTPALITALYTVESELAASLTLRLHADFDVLATLIIERLESSQIFNLAGKQHSTASFPIGDAETITVLIRQHGEIIASGVFQADLRLPESLGKLLVPCSCSMLFLEQQEGTMRDVGTDELLETIQGSLEEIGARR